MELHQSLSIGRCHIFVDEASIQIEGEAKQSIQPKVVEVLLYLAREYPRIIPREELIEHVWDNNELVGEKALTNAIWSLRQKLVVDENQPEVIETIRKKGYRLLIEPSWYSADKVSPNSGQYRKSTKPILINPFTLLIAVILVVSFVFMWSTWQRAEKHHIVTQLTKQPGTELFPSPSPDGRYVVYQWTPNNGDSNLYLSDSKQPHSAPKQLTFDDAVEGHSVWNNAGDTLYFARKDRAAKRCEIIGLNVQLNQEKSITQCPLNGGYYYIDISPDDRVLAFHGKGKGASDSGIYFIDLFDETGVTQRFSCDVNCGYRERDFAFSPDGKYIAVTRRVNRFNENIFLVDLQSKEATQITFGEEDIVGLSWLNDSAYLIFATQRADVRNGYVLNSDSLEINPLNIEGFSYPAIAKHSNDLFFHQRKENYAIATHKVDESVASMPVPLIQSEYSHVHPHYSSVTGRIAFVSNETGHYELWLANADGTDRKQITKLKSTIRYPRWSHNGKRIAFLAPSANEQAEKLFVIDVETQRIQQLDSSFTSFNRPTWTFDDSGLISAIYQADFTDLFLFPLNGQPHRRLTNDNARYGIMISDTELLYTKLDKGLWKKDISSDLAPTLAISSRFNTLYGWEYHDDTVYYSDRKHNAYLLKYAQLSSDTVATIIRLPRRNFASSNTLSFLPESNSLIFSLSQYPQADIKRIRHFEVSNTTPY